MATERKGASDRAKNSTMAARMKALGIRRTTAVCPVCYKTVAIPMDRHFFGGCR